MEQPVHLEQTGELVSQFGELVETLLLQTPRPAPAPGVSSSAPLLLQPAPAPWRWRVYTVHVTCSSQPLHRGNGERAYPVHVTYFPSAPASPCTMETERVHVTLHMCKRWTSFTIIRVHFNLVCILKATASVAALVTLMSDLTSAAAAA
jgi:hypothetical protein